MSCKLSLMTQEREQTMLEQLFLTMLGISLGAAVVIALMLLLAPATGRRFSARWRYAIWLVLALRLVIPVNFSLPEPPVAVPIPVQQVVISHEAATPPTGEDSPMNSGETAAPPQDALGTGQPPVSQPDASISGEAVTPPTEQTVRYQLSLTALLALLWAVGAVLSLLWQGLAYGSFCRSFRPWNRPASPLVAKTLHALSAEMGISREIRLYQNKRIQSPLMTGFFRPVILMPETEFSAADTAIILRHELTHYRRHDLWYKLLLMAARCLHWFNPMVALMLREADSDLEISCDEAVVRGACPDARQQYCETILRIMRQGKNRRMALSTSFYGGKKVLKRRFSAVLNVHIHRGVSVFLLVMMVMLLAGLGIACVSAVQPETVAAAYPKPEINPADLRSYQTVGSVFRNDASSESVDISDWTPLLEHNDWQQYAYLYDSELKDNITGWAEQRMSIYAAPESGHHDGYDRCALLYYRWPENYSRGGEAEEPVINYSDAVTAILYRESEADFGSYAGAKIYLGEGETGLSLYNPTTDTTLSFDPYTDDILSVKGLGDRPLIIARTQMNKREDGTEGQKFLIYSFNPETVINPDGSYNGEYCDVGVYDVEKEELHLIAEHLPNPSTTPLDDVGDGSSRFALYDSTHHWVSFYDIANRDEMAAEDRGNPYEPYFILDESTLALPEGADNFYFDTVMKDESTDSLYTVMYYANDPAKAPQSSNDYHVASGLYWQVAVLSNAQQVSETFDTGLRVWGTSSYPSAPADLILRDGLLYFSYYFNADEVFQRERWVYNVYDSGHARQLIETTLPDGQTAEDIVASSFKVLMTNETEETVAGEAETASFCDVVAQNGATGETTTLLQHARNVIIDENISNSAPGYYMVKTDDYSGFRFYGYRDSVLLRGEVGLATLPPLPQGAERYVYHYQVLAQSGGDFSIAVLYFPYDEAAVKALPSEKSAHVFEMGATWQVALLDENLQLTETFDTEIPVIWISETPQPAIDAIDGNLYLNVYENGFLYLAATSWQGEAAVSHWAVNAAAPSHPVGRID